MTSKTRKRKKRSRRRRRRKSRGCNKYSFGASENIPVMNYTITMGGLAFQGDLTAAFTNHRLFKVVPNTFVVSGANVINHVRNDFSPISPSAYLDNNGRPKNVFDDTFIRNICNYYHNENRPVPIKSLIQEEYVDFLDAFNIINTTQASNPISLRTLFLRFWWKNPDPWYFVFLPTLVVPIGTYSIVIT